MSYHSAPRRRFLGGLGDIVGVSPTVDNGEVRSLQHDLMTLGLLPASGVDGKIGNNTTTAIAQLIYALNLPQDDTTTVVRDSHGNVTVPVTLVNAIHAQALTGSLDTLLPYPPGSSSTTTTTSTKPSLLDSIVSAVTGKPPLPAATTPGTVATTTTTSSIIDKTAQNAAALQQATADQAAAAATPAGTAAPNNTMRWVLIGGGALVLTGIAAVVLTRKKKPAAAAATPAAVAANRRRRRRQMQRNLFGFGGKKDDGGGGDSVHEHQIEGLRHVLSGHANLSPAKKAERVRDLVSRIGRSNLPADLARRADDAMAPNYRRRRAA
jgi:hypothetical protein